MRTKIDRLGLSTGQSQEQTRGFLASLFAHLGEPSYEVRPGAHGFTSAATVTVGGAHVAWWGWGGASQKGRSFVDVSGLGCGLVADWGSAQRAIGGLPGARLTRIDIAADFYRGEVCYADVLTAYHGGRFNRSGRPPKLTQIVPGDLDEGRTAYIGKPGNDVMLRAYEKGKKEFHGLPAAMTARGIQSLSGIDDDGSPFALGDWLRLELELRAKKRPLPVELIGERDQYFAGAYPYLQDVLPEIDPQILVRPEHIAEANLERALEGLRRQYGSTLFTAMTVFGGDVFEVWRRIAGSEHNERLVRAGALLLERQHQRTPEVV